MSSSRDLLNSITRAPWPSSRSNRHAEKCWAWCAWGVDSDYNSAEYAILARSDLKGHGFGWTLMQLIIEYARARCLVSVTLPL